MDQGKEVIYIGKEQDKSTNQDGGPITFHMPMITHLPPQQHLTDSHSKKTAVVAETSTSRQLMVVFDKFSNLLSYHFNLLVYSKSWILHKNLYKFNKITKIWSNYF